MWNFGPAMTTFATPELTASTADWSFGSIPPRTTRVVDHHLRGVGFDRRDELAPVVEQTVDVREEDELVRRERDGHGRRGRVGVDVEQLSAPAESDRADDREHAARHDGADERGVRPGDLSDHPERDAFDRRVDVGRDACRRPRRRIRRPETPAAVSSATSVLLTIPARTSTTISSVGSSVMRSPLCVRFSMPSAARAESIFFPPPWTMTTCSPAFQAFAIAVMARLRSEASSRMLPPSLMTVGPVPTMVTRVPPFRRTGTSG